MEKLIEQYCSDFEKTFESLNVDNINNFTSMYNSLYKLKYSHDNLLLKVVDTNPNTEILIKFIYDTNYSIYVNNCKIIGRKPIYHSDYMQKKLM